MTKDEVIKNLSEIDDNLACAYEECPIYRSNLQACAVGKGVCLALSEAKKIINRQEAEIRAEAIEEFADEIEKALENNYEVRRKRMKKYGSEHDEFLSYVDGKIDCLRGLQGFLKEMVGDSDG